VEIDGDVFAMPMESVIEIVRVPRDKLSTIHGHRTAWVRHRAISVVDLDRVFNWTGRNQRQQTRDSDDVTIVIVGETKGDGTLSIIGVGQAPSRGVPFVLLFRADCRTPGVSSASAEYSRPLSASCRI